MTQIESLLRQAIGLDAASIGSTLIERTVRLRMKAIGLKKVEDYHRRLKSSPSALNELIEAVVVTETWFFRDREPFVTFARMASLQLQKHPGGSLRVLSVPCASGEEPYSLAMALLDQAVSPYCFSINGVDISCHALDRARKGLYGRNSFRGRDLSFRDRHFRHTKEGYLLKPALRERVRFCRDNLLGENFLAGTEPYDFIFCRNLLIYFDRATQVRALERLHRLLTPEGILFLGPAELPLVAGNGFVSLNLPMSFACRKAAVGTIPHAKPSLVSSHSTHRFLTTDNQEKSGSGVREGIDGSNHRRQSSDTSSATPSDLEVASQLADAGRLDEAAAICESFLRTQGPSVQAYYLLGLVCDATGDPKAADCYRKALYLEPNHYESLVHMSLLLEKAGDNVGARTLRRRVERLRQKPAVSEHESMV